MTNGSGCRVAVAVVVLGWSCALVHAQELEPRAYSPAPVGTSFAGVVATLSSGEIAFDAALPFRDVEARVSSVVPFYARTFGLLGRSASVSLATPFPWGTVSGEVGEQRESVRRSGPGDPRIRLAVNLVGTPALTPEQFAARTPCTTLGASLSVVVPAGEYDPTKLINIGANRWAFKPELGLVHPLGRWTLELAAGAWLFTDNDDFYGGQHREQDPIGTIQVHIVRTLRPRMWLALDANYYWGGRSTVDGVANRDLQDNSRVGLTFATPVTRAQSVKLAFSRGARTSIGADFTTVSVTWQIAWMDR